jgi:hypothetical protein
MTDIVAIIMVFGIPLSGIWSYTYLRAKKLNIEGGLGLNNQERLLLRKLAEENQELKNRVINLEEIVTGTDENASYKMLTDAKDLKNEITQILNKQKN